MIVYQQKITQADCDIYGHMNTLKYMEKFYEAADDYMLKFGITDPILAQKGIGCAYLEFNTKFKKEVFADTDIEIDVKIGEKTRKVGTILLQMQEVKNKTIVSEAVLKFLFFDLKTRKSFELADPKIETLAFL